MRLKKSSFFFAFFLLAGLFLLIFNLGNVSAQTCFYTSIYNCQDGLYPILKIPGETNAHTAIPSDTAYSNVICCDFGGGDTTCDGSNKFLGISGNTNAHVERSEFSTYGNICYAGFTGVTTSTTNPGGDSISVLSISSEENAHAGKKDQYDWVVYANPIYSDFDCDLTSASWEFNETTEGSVVDMIVEGIEACNQARSEISFSITRNDGQTCSEISGCTNPSNVIFGAEGNAVGNWTAGPAHSENYTFVATVVGNSDEFVNSNNELRVISGEPEYCEVVTICNDYETESQCNSNLCEDVADNSVPDNIDCDDPDVECNCEWNDVSNSCEATWDGLTDSGDTQVGTCTYAQSVTNSCEEEPVGQLSFSWNATWEWSSPGVDPDLETGECEEGYVLWEGSCYYDPEGKSAQCQPGETTRICPAQIPLPFFNMYSFLITIILVVAVYMVLNLRKPGRKKNHIRKRRM